MKLDFTPGQTAFVEQRAGAHQIRGVGRIIGAKDGDFVVLEAPQAEGALMKLEERSRCIVRFLNRGAMIGFWGVVLKTYAEPSPLLIVSLPKEYEEITLRKTHRIPCHLEARAEFEAPESEPGADEASPEAPPGRLGPLDVVISDLGAGGCQIAVPLIDADDPSEEMRALTARIPEERRPWHEPEMIRAMCRAGSHVSLDFALPEPAPGDFRGVVCDVCWGLPSQGHFFVGLKFVEEEAELHDKVARLVAHQTQHFAQRFHPIR